MSTFSLKKSNLSDGNYFAEITGCKVNNSRINLIFKVEEQGITFQPCGVFTEMSEYNPLYLFLKECGYSDRDILALNPQDLIGYCVKLTVENKKGNSRNFCNIKSMHPIFEEDDVA